MSRKKYYCIVFFKVCVLTRLIHGCKCKIVLFQGVFCKISIKYACGVAVSFASFQNNLNICIAAVYFKTPFLLRLEMVERLVTIISDS